MDLTPGQKSTLLAAIQNDATALQMYTDGNLSGLADYYNAASDPAFVVWKTEVTEAEILNNGMDWTRVDNLTPGPARVWEWMFKFGSANPSKANVRAGIEAVWKGTAQDLAVRAAVFAHCKRAASRVEKILATGTGSDATPGDLVFVGPIAYMQFQGLE